MYCITLKGSARVADVSRELARVGLEDVTLLARTRDVQDGKRGCFESHQAALRAGLADGHDAVVVFEDDVCFRDRGSLPVAQLVEEARALALARPDCIVGIGGMAMGPMGSWVTPRFCECKFAYTHGIVVGAQVAREMLEWQYHGEHIDRVLQQRANAMLLAVPSVAFQRSYLHDMTTTEDTVAYRCLTALRNVLGPAAVQIAFERFWRLVGCVLAGIRSVW